MFRLLTAALFGAGTAISTSSIVFAAPAGVQAGVHKKELPSFSMDDIKKHNNSKDRIWVVYKAGVYDITDFVDAHPGGRNRIMLAAGASIEPFWRQFAIHNQDEVRKILEQHRIGNLAGFDVKKAEEEQKRLDAEAARIWDHEPDRHPALGVKSSRPFNAETPADALTGAAHVANELFFVRNHMPVPSGIDLADFCLEVKGEGLRRRCHTLDDLKAKFAEHTVSTTIQCGGNRRTDASKAGPVKGLGWTAGGIGNAEWTGVWLRDVLAEAAGCDGLAATDAHVRFGGLDKDAASSFEVSIPVEMAMSPDRDVLIAYRMNGEPIPRDHGFPLRAVVPGVVGVRNCKWLKSVTVSRDESQSDWQQRDYKNFPAWLTSPELGYESVYETPIQSQITEATRDGASVTVKGYAYCGGGRGVQRVEVSADGGDTFRNMATLDDLGIKQARGKRWAWYQFESTFDLKGDAATRANKTEDKEFEVCTRAVSGTQDVQPRVAAANFRGLLYNGYSCVKV